MYDPTNASVVPPAAIEHSIEAAATEHSNETLLYVSKYCNPETGYKTCATLEMQGRGHLHAHINSFDSYEYNLLLYWAASRPVARVHMAIASQRRACRGLRATWTLQRMIQLGCYDLRGCHGCGEYPTTSTCGNCSTAWCHSCCSWSVLCWRCYRPRYNLADTGEFMPGFGGPGGNGSFE